jgi:parvulin-like peptidyl-prolyl isomerase
MQGEGRTIAAESHGQPIYLEELLAVLRFGGQFKVLDGALDEIIIGRAAENAGIQVSDEELQSAANAFRTRQGLHTSRDTLRWLERNGLSLDALEGELSRRLRSEKLAAQVADDRVERHFARNIREFDAVEVRQLVVEKEDLALELLSEVLDDGRDFTELVLRHSIDPRRRKVAGYMGWLSRRDFSPVAEALVFGANVGEVVGPVKSEAGYELFEIIGQSNGELTNSRRMAIRKKLIEEYAAKERRQAAATWLLP